MNKKIQSPEDFAEFLHKASVAESLLRELLKGAKISPDKDGDYFLYWGNALMGNPGIVITSEEANLARELIEEGKER